MYRAIFPHLKWELCCMLLCLHQDGGDPGTHFRLAKGCEGQLLTPLWAQAGDTSEHPSLHRTVPTSQILERGWEQKMSKIEQLCSCALRYFGWNLLMCLANHTSYSPHLA